VPILKYQAQEDPANPHHDRGDEPMPNDVLVQEPMPSVTPAPAAAVTLTPPAPAAAPDDLGLDRDFLMQLARMPLYAVLWVVAAYAAHQIWAAVAPETTNLGPLVVIGFGMVLAAFIDGWALKVPNWVTLPLVLSGWMIGLLHNLGLDFIGGTGGIGMAVAGTFLGFALLFPMLAIRGVGEGDVKMQMGFGAWVGAYFGTQGPTGLHTLGVVFWAFCFGAIVGGAFGLIMILIRRKFGQNASTVGEIMMDLQLFATGSAMQATRRAEQRRSRWVKIPYGIPLCVGFFLYLWYALFLA
jgi:prepilin peptidase CpaA